MAIIDYQDYLAEGMYIFPLHEIIKGKCGCGDEECHAVGKHPLQSSWQHITTWDDDQIAYFSGEDGIGVRNCFEGFGVNLAGHHLLVVDVDARNGGVDALERLNSDLGINLQENAEFVVLTGSGNGSLHIYFKVPESWQSNGLLQGLDAYKGIDFKTTGFVVGCGSIHVSGDYYTSIKGGPADIIDAPMALLELLKRPDRIRSTFSGSVAEYSFEELRAIVEAIKNPGRDYEKWIRIGMAIHHATNGSMDGYDLWNDWSRKGEAHDDSRMDMKWHSFGKNPQDQVTIGTLTVWAKEDGYSAPVTFECDTEWEIPVEDNSITSAAVRESVNIKRPPGLVGMVTDWINSRSLFPRENLAVAAAITVVSNAAGLRHRVEGWETTLNQFVFGIAGSSTGKESVLGSITETHRVTGISSALVGKIKSEQELTRNLLRNQAAFYAIDELGQELRKLSNATKKGGSPYLEGIMGAMMSVYSKGAGVLPVSGDMKQEMMDALSKDMAVIIKRMDSGQERENDQARLTQLSEQMRHASDGIPDPFLSVYGTGEPTVFAGAVDREMMTAGFMGRALVVEEKNNVPDRVDMATYKKSDVPMGMQVRLSALYSGGHTVKPGDRVERKGDIVYIKWSPEAHQAQNEIYEYWRDKARQSQDEGTGLESTINRALEVTVKLAATLAVESGVITLEHMRYAHAFVYKSTMWKIYKLLADDGSEKTATVDTRSQGVIAAIRSQLDKKDGVSIGILKNRYRNKYTEEQLKEGLDWMVGEGTVILMSVKKNNGRTYDYYKLA